MNDVHVRPATLQDVPGILPLWDELMAWHENLDPSFARCENATATFQAFLESNITSEASDRFVLVACDGDDASHGTASLVGYCMGGISERPPVYEVRRIGYIWDMLVTARARRRGTGSTLVARATGWFKAKGISRVELHAAARNSTSQAFWTAAGFQPCMVNMWRAVNADQASEMKL